jgi:tRNA(His) 5'-end guanylyltransferase
MKQDNSLGNRMKSNYEDRFRINLPRRTNILIRIDGKAFHSYTKGLERPYDMGLMEDMNNTTKYLCENIQGAKMGYVQSDEISILITDYDDISTHAWFDNNLQKMCSISASMATAKFNDLRTRRLSKLMEDLRQPDEIYIEFPKKLATFDARVCIIPEAEEVVNYFIWRQQDATRNSISMAAQSLFSHKELQGKSSNEMQEMMITLKDTNWNDFPERFRRGSAIVKVESKISAKDFKVKNNENEKLSMTLNDLNPNSVITRTSWNVVDTPVFTQDRDFILKNFVKISI